MAEHDGTGLIAGEDGRKRCWWHGGLPDYQISHDTEWGFPVDNDRRLFEKICLEGFQSGLSWLTILRKRDNFRAAFDNFDPEIVKRGWSFVGPTTVYAFMQAMGLVNDHVEGCFCRNVVEAARKAFKRPG